MNGQESHIPTISVVLPAYNVAAYLAASVQSILSQTFRDFELIIINDGSTDHGATEQVCRSFADPRVRYIHHDQNKGLIAVLNEGIDLAKGRYIARMDGDDLALPERFEVQLNYFKQYPDAALVCSPINTITPNGNPGPPWKADRDYTTPEAIAQALPKENCIAHPTVLIKTEIIKQYRYRPEQKGSEDWDLWMRLAADGYTIVKTKEVLLKYRIHPQSTTIQANQANSVEKKVATVRWNFLKYRLSRLKTGRFECRAFYALLRSMARHIKLNVIPGALRSIKHLGINPIKASQQFRYLKQLCAENPQPGLFFFFPYAGIGGAEKVHVNIIDVFKEKKPVVFITGISGDEGFLHLFREQAPTAHVGYCLYHPFFKRRTEALIYNLVDAQPEPVIFGCNNLFFYEAILKFKQSARIFDLMHDFRFEGEEHITHAFAAQYFRCEKRIFISHRALEQTRLFYKYINADPQEFDKLTLIINYTDVPAHIQAKPLDGPLRVLYVGRGTSEKRAHIVGKLAKQCLEKNKGIEFTAVGDLSAAIPDDCKSYVRLPGPVYDFEILKTYYETHHVILITSEREGFPLAVMEGMAYGLVPVSTPVGDMPYHVNNDRGYITSSLEEPIVIREMTEQIMAFQKDRKRLEAMSEQARSYALLHFTKERFFREYKAAVFPMK